MLHKLSFFEWPLYKGVWIACLCFHYVAALWSFPSPSMVQNDSALQHALYMHEKCEHWMIVLGSTLLPFMTINFSKFLLELESYIIDQTTSHMAWIFTRYFALLVVDATLCFFYESHNIVYHQKFRNTPTMFSIASLSLCPICITI